MCVSGGDVQSVRTRCRFHVLSSESEDEDSALELSLAYTTDARGRRTHAGGQCKQRPYDAQQIEDWCWCPRSGTTTRHNPSKTCFPSRSVDAELSEEAPDDAEGGTSQFNE